MFGLNVVSFLLSLPVFCLFLPFPHPFQRISDNTGWIEPRVDASIQISLSPEENSNIVTYLYNQVRMFGKALGNYCTGNCWLSGQNCCSGILALRFPYHTRWKCHRWVNIRRNQSSIIFRRCNIHQRFQQYAIEGSFLLLLVSCRSATNWERMTDKFILNDWNKRWNVCLSVLYTRTYALDDVFVNNQPSVCSEPNSVCINEVDTGDITSFYGLIPQSFIFSNCSGIEVWFPILLSASAAHASNAIIPWTMHAIPWES